MRQLQADIYGKPVIPVEQEEGPAFGAALLAAVGAGAFPDVPSATKATLRRKPAQQPSSEAHAAYEAPYRMYRKLYGGIKAASVVTGTHEAHDPSSPTPLLHVRVEERVGGSG